jgi:O-antigen ligase
VNGPLLVLILIYAAATVWVRERWALSALEAVVFLSSAAAAVRMVLRKSVPHVGFLVVAFAAMALWGMAQLATGWTVVKADTTEAVLYWLTAACLVWLGRQACTGHKEKERFLKSTAIAGSAICMIGLLQLYTGDGRIFWIFPSGYDSRIPGPFVSSNNYAEFVELLLPVVLVLAIRRGLRSSYAYLALAAALVASAIASGSRAGAALVILEIVVISVMARQKSWALAAFVGLAVLFVGMVGHQYLWERLVHDSDPYRTRREFLESTLAMIRTRPLHGFGLGAWTSAYPRFALIDIGRYANHAHNEWAQWTAEGGLPAFTVMLVVFLWTLRAAIKSLWGIGVVAVMVHSLVDYPFMRLGLAAWIFVLLGALEAGRYGSRPAILRPQSYILAGATVPFLLLGVFYTAKLGWADTLYHRGTLDSLRRAVILSPGHADYELSLAQVDSTNSLQHLEKAASFNPSATNARILLAGELEDKGDTVRSENVLLEAARNDRQFAPAWALANFYFRNREPEKFWPWAKAAAEVYRGDLRPLFDLCFLVSDKADSVMGATIAKQHDAERQFLYYLLEHHRLPAARATALRILKKATHADRDALLGYVDAELAAGNAVPASEIWQQICQEMVPCGAADSGIANGNFGTPILNRGFDWLLPSIPGVVATQIREGGPVLSLALSGKEPEVCEVLGHFLALRNRAHYKLHFEYRTAGFPPLTGLYWSLGAEQIHQLESAGVWSSVEWRFLSTGEIGRLSLEYRRYPGTTRLEGTMFLRNVSLEPEEAPAFHNGFSFP